MGRRNDFCRSARKLARATQVGLASRDSCIPLRYGNFGRGQQRGHLPFHVDPTQKPVYDRGTLSSFPVENGGKKWLPFYPAAVSFYIPIESVASASDRVKLNNFIFVGLTVRWDSLFAWDLFYISCYRFFFLFLSLIRVTRAPAVETISLGRIGRVDPRSLASAVPTKICLSMLFWVLLFGLRSTR